MCFLYKVQHDAGRYYIHEHPKTAGPWKESIIVEIEEHTDAENHILR